MTSLRSIGLNFENGPDYRVQLGRPIEKNGAKIRGDILFPRATGASVPISQVFPAPPIAPITVPASGSTDQVFANGPAFVSGNVTYGGPTPPLFILPYTGVPSVYEISIYLRYQFSNPGASSGNLTMEVTMVDSTGATFTRTAAVTFSSNTAGSFTMRFEYTGQIQQITRVRVNNNTNRTVTLLPSTGRETFMSVLYAGTP